MAKSPHINDDSYREYWAYIRHVESLRFQMASVVAVVSGATLGWIVSAAGSGRGVSFGRALARNEVIGVVLLALAVFVGLAGRFLIGHKVNYDWYVARVRARGDGVGTDGPPEEVFGWLLAMFAVVEVAVAVVLCTAEDVGWRALGVLIPGFVILTWAAKYPDRSS